ncbi:hypothetical protein AMATHDRAFT_76870 [Amanita thiersii Skay4041]|uniref:Nucleoside phosphorylase domain-containing protein n=1 Tax=Amanita thiersii Skay4041 TaxID=703135 RepID=A0A2A9NKC8_9AGAR|nr:hypothetical protein AMATHDRAFT_76870 [Amanita thiersii Skay4041]
MKDTLKDANFPRTADQRVYHLGLRPGDIANRIIVVGSHTRARTLRALLDAGQEPFILASERGFLTITGRYKHVPVSIVSIGMGSPNMDFFIREGRECLIGDMIIVRFGSCGALIDVPVGSVVVPKACVAINRNVDYDFINGEDESSGQQPYLISKPTTADATLYAKVLNGVIAAKPENWLSDVIGETTNASADSFYCSQGRQTSFPDHNSDLIKRVKQTVPDLATLEMETFHLYHLAACWGGGKHRATRATPAPITNPPVDPIIIQPAPTNPYAPLIDQAASPDTTIRAAAAQMVFASRTSQDFITPQQVDELENWVGAGILNALIDFGIPQERLHPEKGSVWEQT